MKKLIFFLVVSNVFFTSIFGHDDAQSNSERRQSCHRLWEQLKILIWLHCRDFMALFQQKVIVNILIGIAKNVLLLIVARSVVGFFHSTKRINQLKLQTLASIQIFKH